MKTRIFLLVALLLAPCAIAGVRHLTLFDLCHNSTRIVHGVVTAQSPRWDGTLIVTDWTVKPTRNLKGSGAGAFRVRVPGGTIGGTTMRAGEAPRLRVGEEVVLFLRPGMARCDVYGWFRGKYTVVAGQVREKQGTSLNAFLEAITRELTSEKKEK